MPEKKKTALKSTGGKILHVNLTTRQTWTESSAEYIKKYIGGRGVNLFFLYDLVKPWCSPFDPANVLIFGAGTLGGTLATGASRLSIETKSPVTGGLGSANAGGYFAPELKYAGYDHIVITGRARNPVYLWIDDDKVEIRDASHLWGQIVGETIRLIKEELNDTEIETACIGPAGENLVRFAHIVVSQTRAAARCGVGAVMGSKNLKAIAVRGSKPIEVADPERFMSKVDKFWGAAKQQPVIKAQLKQGLIRRAPTYLQQKLDISRNFQKALDPEKFKHFMPENFDPFEIRRITSHACPQACFRVYKITDGPYDGTICHGITLNDLYNFAIKFDLDYPPAVIKAHDVCTEYGIDEDAAAGVIAWAFECYQRGILTGKETDGLELLWGNHKVLIDLLVKIAERKGIGDLLAEGSMQASQIIGKGSENFAIHIKGADSMENMRGLRSWSLGCAVSTRGGTHLRGAHIFDGMKDLPEEFRERWHISEPWDPRGFEGKAASVIRCENLKGVADSLGLCWFFTTWWGPGFIDADEMAELYTAAIGQEMTGNEILKIGDRIHNLEKAFNVRHAGFARKDDYPPKRFMEEKVTGGIADDDILPKEKWDIMLGDYYEQRNWDKNADADEKVPDDLGMQDIANDLEKAGRLPSLTITP